MPDSVDRLQRRADQWIEKNRGVLHDRKEILTRTRRTERLTPAGAEGHIRDGRLEVMLGYSDSAKDVGFLAANIALHRTQGELAAWATVCRVVLNLHETITRY